MATIAIAQSRRSSPFPVVLFLLLAIAAVTVAYFFNAHAYTKHGTDATTVDECFDKNPTPFISVTSPDGRIWELCKISEHLVALRLYCYSTEDCKVPVTEWKMPAAKLVRLLLRNNAIGDEMAAKILTEFLP